MTKLSEKKTPNIVKRASKKQNWCDVFVTKKIEKKTV